MEMPEGYENLIKKFENHPAPYGMLQAMCLLKEMAEALEEINQVEGLGYQHQTAFWALHKFKEWK